MNLLGVMWIVCIVLKMLGIIATGWLMVLFWPFILMFCFVVVMALCGCGLGGIAYLLIKWEER